MTVGLTVSLLADGVLGSSVTRHVSYHGVGMW